VNIDSAFDSVVRAVVRARAAETPHRKGPNKDVSFNPNVGFLEAKRNEAEAAAEEESVKARPKTKNKKLKLDR
jgi:hypothetical protein